jgi:hypothetical protein
VHALRQALDEALVKIKKNEELEEKVRSQGVWLDIQEMQIA